MYNRLSKNEGEGGQQLPSLVNNDNAAAINNAMYYQRLLMERANILGHSNGNDDLLSSSSAIGVSSNDDDDDAPLYTRDVNRAQAIASKRARMSMMQDTAAAPNFPYSLTTPQLFNMQSLLQHQQSSMEAAAARRNMASYNNFGGGLSSASSFSYLPAQVLSPLILQSILAGAAAGLAVGSAVASSASATAGLGNNTYNNNRGTTKSLESYLRQQQQQQEEEEEPPVTQTLESYLRRESLRAKDELHKLVGARGGGGGGENNNNSGSSFSLSTPIQPSSSVTAATASRHLLESSNNLNLSSSSSPGPAPQPLTIEKYLREQRAKEIAQHLSLSLSDDLPSLPHKHRTKVFFPQLLYDMIEREEEEATTGKVITWCDNGSIEITDKSTLVSKVLPKYFKATKYESFERQLKRWGFKRKSRKNSVVVCWYNPNFYRGMDMVADMGKLISGKLITYGGSKKRGKDVVNVDGDDNYHQGVDDGEGEATNMPRRASQIVSDEEGKSSDDAAEAPQQATATSGADIRRPTDEEDEDAAAILLQLHAQPSRSDDVRVAPPEAPSTTTSKSLPPKKRKHQEILIQEEEGGSSSSSSGNGSPVNMGCDHPATTTAPSIEERSTGVNPKRGSPTIRRQFHVTSSDKNMNSSVMTSSSGDYSAAKKTHDQLLRDDLERMNKYTWQSRPLYQGSGPPPQLLNPPPRGPRPITCFSSLRIGDDPLPLSAKVGKSSNPPAAKKPCRHLGCNDQAKKRFLALMKVLMR